MSSGMLCLEIRDPVGAKHDRLLSALSTIQGKQRSVQSALLRV
jgi:hypothetical protein